MKKTIFFDVDNTLVCREKNKINDSTIKAIEALIRKEINVAIATGRSLAMVKQESFYKMFKEGSKSRFESIYKILQALNIKLVVAS